MKTILKNTSVIALLTSVACTYPGVKTINSFVCAETITGAKEVIGEGQKAQKLKADELQQIQVEGQKIATDVAKERNDLNAKRSMMSVDAVNKEERKIKDKERKLGELQNSYQQVMRDLQVETEEFKLALQPFLLEAIETTREAAKNDATIDLVFDLFTNQVIYSKENNDMSTDVIKLTQKKNEQKALLAKSKPVAKASATKVA
jgi:Skp family chaperone for outer membrane proteins